jgi:formylglycine-generating enzyme required for sulfatase activity
MDSSPTVTDNYGGLRVVMDVAATYRVVDLTTGAVTDAEDVPDLLTNTEGPGGTSKYKTTHLVLKRIPAGTFQMGDETGDGVPTDEHPVHTVNITKPFYIGVFEVTQQQWQTITGSNPSFFTGLADSPSRPVEQSAWVDCNAYLAQISTLAGVTLRLPTEAEWEYACKAGTHGNYSCADADIDSHVWYDLNSSGTTHEVGSKLANPWGLYDVHGNVWEWCEDWHDPGYYSVSPADDPQGAVSSPTSERVSRGGAWEQLADECRSAQRYMYIPSSAGHRHGLRVVLAP